MRGSSCLKCGYTQTIKKCLHSIIGKTKVVFWGRKYFHWKNVSTLYFLFYSLGRSSAVHVIEGPRCSNPSRMKAKIFPLFLLLTRKIILLCVMLQTHHCPLTLRTFLPSPGDTVSGYSLRLDQRGYRNMFVQDPPMGGTITGYLPCNA